MNAKNGLISYWIVALCVLGACSQGAAPTQGSASTDPASTSAAQASSATGGNNASRNPCDVITAADVSGIFTAPAKAGDTAELTPKYKNCQYATKSAYVSVVVSQIGPGDDMAWQVATTYNHVDVPVAGIGDTARRNANGTKLAARKSDMYCGIEVVGYDSPDNTVTGDRGDALAKKLGALCNKLFASH